MIKNLLIFIALILLFSVSAGEGMENKLLGYWRFDEGEGVIVADCSGNGHDGTIQNNMRAVEWVDGRKGKALRFSGTRSGNKSGCVKVPDFNYDLSRGMTVEAWIKIDDNVSLEGLYEIITNSTANCGIGFRLYYNWKNFVFMSGAGGDHAETWRAVCQKGASYIGKWIHIAATYDGSVYKLYIDGEEVASSRNNQPFTNGCKFLFIGSAHNGAAYGFQGMIDDVRIYNYALSQNDILKNAKFDL